MLGLMRKNASNWLIKFILGAIVIVFVFWGVGSFTSRKANRAAEVNGQMITIDDYQQAYKNLLEQYRNAYGNNLTDDMMKLLRPGQQALNQLVDRVLMLQEAERLDLRVGDEELAAAVRSMPAFQSEGRFDVRRYRQILNRLQMSPEQFENSRKDGLLIDKLRRIVLNGVTVSDAEALEWYNWNNARVRIDYVLFSADSIKNVIPTEEQITTYYETHQSEFQTEPKVKVSYLHIDPRQFEEKVTVGDDEISDYYDQHADQFATEKTVQARHILFKVAEDADEKTVAEKKDKAEQVLKMARDGKDFAELAKTYSEGPSRENGGQLGTFKKATMVKPFAEKAFTMEAGQISEPVRTRFGWHIIKVEKVNPASVQPLDKASAQIRQTLTVQKSKTLAYNEAEDLYQQILDGNDLIQTAQAARMPLVTSDFFTRQGPESGIVDRRKFAEAAFELGTSETSDILDLSDGYYMIQVLERKEAATPPLDQIKDKVVAVVTKSQQEEKAKQAAEQFLSAVAGGNDWASVAQQHGIEAKTSDYFKRSGTIEGIGYEPQLNTAAFELSDEHPVAKTAVKGAKGYFAIRLKDRQLPDTATFAKEKATVVKQLAGQKRNGAFSQWLAGLRAGAEIWENERLVGSY